jgi:hypothetical protein
MTISVGFHSSNEYFTAPLYYKVTHVASGDIWSEGTINSKSWYWSATKNRDKIDDYLNLIVNDKNNCSLINENQQIPAPPDNHWPCFFNNRVCNTASDYDYLSWFWNECGNSYDKPPENTKIELLASPNSNYYHFVASYNRSQNKWTITQDNNSGFTVSTNGDCNIVLQGKDLVSGTFRWKITDNCGRNDLTEVPYVFYKYEIEEPFSFAIETTCEGKKYLPKVKMAGIRKDDGHKINIPVSFEVSGDAGGYFPSTGLCNYDHITFTKPGNYTVTFNINGTNIDCFIPPKSITYTYNGLSIINAYGYACDDGFNHVRKVVVTVDSTSGVAPYKFDLYDQYGVFIASNNTGIFYDAGAPNETVLVTISDKCGTSYGQNVKITNLESGANVAFANSENVCFGDAIFLHGIAITGALMGYVWKGPDNFSSLSKDPVIYNSTLRHEGDYILSITGLECAIIDSVFITIIPPDTAYYEDFVCPDSKYANYGFEIDPLLIPDTTFIFYNSNLKSNLYQCDSTACLILNVREYASLLIDSVGEICADAPFFVLPCNLFGENNLFYNLRFNEHALLQGFIDIDSGRMTYNDRIEIQMPYRSDIQEYVMPHNNYAASILVNNGTCNSRNLEFPFQISYPNWILEQKWNDVIALLNDRYNGGYTFSKYEWFKNGEKLKGENRSYIYILPTLDFGAEYRALVTRTLDGEACFTCPLIPQYRSNVKVYPQFISQNEPIFVETQEDGNVTIWNLLGQKIAQHPVWENQVNKIYLNETGFFLLEVVTINRFKQTFKIIVK